MGQKAGLFGLACVVVGGLAWRRRSVHNHSPITALTRGQRRVEMGRLVARRAADRGFTKARS
ncbi:MAG: hypothetical protein ACI9C1_004080, partial [Candidatus Aldehydirespiratoraceae bacterium]